MCDGLHCSKFVGSVRQKFVDVCGESQATIEQDAEKTRSAVEWYVAALEMDRRFPLTIVGPCGEKRNFALTYVEIDFPLLTPS